MDIQRTKPFSLEDLLSRREQPPVPLSRPQNLEKGQLWWVSKTVAGWSADKNDVPLLLPVLLISEEHTIEEMHAVDIIQIHYLREAAASDDLLCPLDAPGVLQGAVIPSWAVRTINVNHLESFLGTIPDELLAVLDELLEPSETGSYIRAFTGPSAITKSADFRIPLREKIVRDTEILSASAKAYLAYRDRFRAIEETIVKHAIEKELSELEQHMPDLWRPAAVDEYHCIDSVNADKVLTAGRTDLACLTEDDVERELSAIRQLDFTPLQRLGHTMKLLLDWFGARPLMSALPILEREVAAFESQAH